ncbi:MAG: two-component system response regulator [Roseburia sp. 40_7]|nr:MAG: two-component system response regulator [Roseburia sp. 40_7]
MKYQILIVDDAELNREMLKEMLLDEYDVLEADNGKMALEIIDKEWEHIHAILLDIVMPVMDGFEVLAGLQERKVVGKIPVLVISGDNTSRNEKKCFDYGVYDFIGRPFNSVLVKLRVKNMVNQYVYKNQLEEKVQEQTAVLRKAYETVKMQAEELEKRNQDIIEVLGAIVEYRDVESGEHIQRVKGYALHDLGKIAIPDRILLKPGRLDKDEFEYMKSHTIRGCEILESMKVEWNPAMKEISLEIIRHHHERYDGKGYPDGLKGDEIPISAQLVSVADVYDALINERCYKDAYSKEEAFHMIMNGECGAFSPKLLKTFRSVKKQFEELSEKKEQI